RGGRVTAGSVVARGRGARVRADAGSTVPVLRLPPVLRCGQGLGGVQLVATTSSTGRPARRTTGTRRPDPSRRRSAVPRNGRAGRGARRASAVRLGTRRTIRVRAAPPRASPEAGA